MFIFNLIGKTADGAIHTMRCYAHSEDEMDSVVCNWIEHTDYVERELYIVDYKRG